MTDDYKDDFDDNENNDDYVNFDDDVEDFVINNDEGIFLDWL